MRQAEQLSVASVRRRFAAAMVIAVAILLAIAVLAMVA
jgi:hypothetical protein